MANRIASSVEWACFFAKRYGYESSDPLPTYDSVVGVKDAVASEGGGIALPEGFTDEMQAELSVYQSEVRPIPHPSRSNLTADAFLRCARRGVQRDQSESAAALRGCDHGVPWSSGTSEIMTSFVTLSRVIIMHLSQQVKKRGLLFLGIS